MTALADHERDTGASGPSAGWLLLRVEIRIVIGLEAA
jgi:hypothetical protein